MNNRIHNFLSSSEQRLILFVGIIALFGYTLDLLAFQGAEFKAAAADSLAVALEEDEALVIDIRVANAEELMCLPGIGPKRAEDILQYREANPFTSVNQIMLVKGIGLKTYHRILPYLTVFGDSLATELIAPTNSASATLSQDLGIVNINTAGLEELCTLKGIGPAKAEAIIRYREEQGPFSTPEDLTKVKGIGTKTLENNLSRIRI